MKNKIYICIFLMFSFFINDVAAATLTKDTIELFHLSENYEEFLTLPDTYSAEEQIILNNASGNVTYAVKSGDTVTVDSNGLVKIQPEISYCSGIFCYDYEASGTTKVETYKEGTNIIEITDDNGTYEITVNVYLYEKYNAEKIMKDHIANNITESMTEYEKMEIILELISTTNYSVSYSSYIGLFSANGGDCWASSYAIVYMSDLVGIKAHVRDARRDTGAGSGHRNIAAILDGKTYVVEGGYNEVAPRSTDMYLTIDGFSVGGKYFTSDSPYIQYDGYDEYVTIPANDTISKLGAFAFYYGSHAQTKVKTVYVPSTITEIGQGAFALVDTLDTIIVDSENSVYKSIDGILYSKDGTVLHSYPSGKKNESFTIPEGVEELYNSSLAYDSDLKEIVFPSTLKIIGTAAFYDSGLKGVVVPKNVETIGDKAFSSSGIGTIGSQANYLVVQNPDAVLGDDLCSSIRPIYGLKGSTAEEYATTNNCLFGEISEDQTIFKYISETDITVSSVEYDEDGAIPEILIKDGEYTLQENVDYTVTFSNNNRVTDYAKAKIMGIGSYVGYLDKDFSVTKKKISYTYTNPVVDYTGSVQSPIFTTEDEGVTIYYGNNAYSNLSTDLREYTQPGTYTFGVRITGNNYEGVYLNDLTFTINHLDFTKAQMNEIDDFPYVASYIYPEIEIKYNNQTLVKNEDYYCYLSNNYNPGIATINCYGKGLYSGTISKTFKILANDEYELKLNKDNVILGIGASTVLSVYSTPAVLIAPSYVTWTSLNPEIVSVDDQGKVTALQKGSATIRAKFNGKTVTTKIEVVDYLKGDMNQNGKIEVADALEILYVVIGKKTATDTKIAIGDMNNNTKLEAIDAIEILRIYMKG